MAGKNGQRERGLAVRGGTNRESAATRDSRISKQEALRTPQTPSFGTSNRGAGSGRGDFARNTQRSRGEFDGKSFVQRGAESQRGVPSTPRISKQQKDIRLASTARKNAIGKKFGGRSA